MHTIILFLSGCFWILQVYPNTAHLVLQPLPVKCYPLRQCRLHFVCAKFLMKQVEEFYFHFLIVRRCWKYPTNPKPKMKTKIFVNCTHTHTHAQTVQYIQWAHLWRFSFLLQFITILRKKRNAQIKLTDYIRNQLFCAQFMVVSLLLL